VAHTFLLGTNYFSAFKASFWHKYQVLPLYSFSGYYTAKYKYHPTRNDIAVFARTVGTDNWDERFITAMKHIKVKKYATSSPTYTFDDLVKFRAIVYFSL